MSVIGAIGFMVTAGLLFNIVFSSKDDFVNCLKYYFTKILIWLILSALVGYGVHQVFA